MITFTKFISILALGMAAAIAAPDEIPSMNNNYTLWTGAQAADIKRASVSKRQVRLRAAYKGALRNEEVQVIYDPDNEDIIINDRLNVRVPISTDEGDTESANNVEISVSYIDAIGNLVEVETGKGILPRWTQVAVVQSARLSENGKLNFSVMRRNKTIDMSVTPSPEVGEIVIAKVGETQTYAEVILQDDDRYILRISGPPRKMKKYCTDFKNEGDTCLTSGIIQTINDEPTGPAEVTNLWDVNLKGVQYSDLEGMTYFVETKAFNELGDIIDMVTVSGVVNEDETGRTTDELGFIDFGVSNDGGLGLLVISEPLDFRANASLTANITAEDFGTNLIDVADIPATPLRVFYAEDINFIDSGNVVDMEYDFETEIYDAFGNSLATGTLKGIVPSEYNFEVETQELAVTCCVFEEPFEGPSPLEVNYLAAVAQNEDTESFSVCFAIEGELARQAASVNIMLKPDDGGSDADPEEFDLPNNDFVNFWRVVAPSGAEATEIVSGSSNVKYSLSISSDGKIQDILSGQDTGQILFNKGIIGPRAPCRPARVKSKF